MTELSSEDLSVQIDRQIRRQPLIHTIIIRSVIFATSFSVELPFQSRNQPTYGNLYILSTSPYKDLIAWREIHMKHGVYIGHGFLFEEYRRSLISLWQNSPFLSFSPFDPAKTSPQATDPFKILKLTLCGNKVYPHFKILILPFLPPTSTFISAWSCQPPLNCTIWPKIETIIVLKPFGLCKTVNAKHWSTCC